MRSCTLRVPVALRALQLRYAKLELVDPVPENFKLGLVGKLSLRRTAEPR